MHSDIASRQDNYRKRKFVLLLPTDRETGTTEYCVHWQRELRLNFKSLFVVLTGRDTRGDPVEGMNPLTYWQRIQRLTSTPSRPLGIVGSPKLLTKQLCPCLASACISQCSCPHCTTFLENLDHRHLASVCGWRRPKTSVCVVVPESASVSNEDSDTCDKCGGDCLEGPWKTMSAGLQQFLTAILCPPVEVQNVWVSAVDPDTGLEIPGNRTAVKMIPRNCWLGKCTHCGWDNVFSNLPRLPVTIVEDLNATRQEFVRACPREAREDVYTTYHEFRKMERGTGSDGKPFVQPEWTPVTATRRMFYYQLTQFMRDFLPHYYKVLWNEQFTTVFTQHYKRLAYLEHPHLPQPHPSMFGTAILIKDFAACIDHDKKFNKTCAYPERSHEWVGVYQCEPYLHHYRSTSLPQR